MFSPSLPGRGPGGGSSRAMHMTAREKRHRIRPSTTERSRELRREMTGPERRLWSILRRSNLGGFKFRRQAPIGRYLVDFYCPALKLAVELDGESHIGTGEQDEARTRELMAGGDRVLRITNDDVMQNLYEVGEHILNVAIARQAELEAAKP